MAGLDHFLNAARFLTILPAPPSSAAPETDWLARAMKHFALVGAGVGCASAVVFVLASHIWGSPLAAIMAVAVSVILTGALHEDGLADTADAFGGGWTIEKRLAIMKDSRIGSYGALALGFSVLLRIAALATLSPWEGAAALVAVHATARAAPALLMNNMAYVGDTAAMKVGYDRSGMVSADLLFLLLTALAFALPLAFISIPSAFAGLAGGAVLATALALWSRKLIGGYTGDVLGAAEQVFEIGFLLGVAATI
ncbi:MAG: adenosylcobinamide-GDP ribazoletransferase [Bradyrhizobium sp.]|nr:adenosylcobinamide-GDP ribazoletransferase [Bradyrhizobium sp.]